MPLVKILATQDKTPETPVNYIGGNVDYFALEKLIEANVITLYLITGPWGVTGANLFLSLGSPVLFFSNNSAFRSSPFLHEIGY